MKHRIKMGVRELYARVLYHTGLHALVHRMMPQRLLILAGHCVSPCPDEEFLAPDMRVDVDRLEALMAWLQKRYSIVTVADGVAALDGKATDPPRGLVALSMDDGYKDNHGTLLPMLRRLGIPATVYLETRPLDERRPNWNHKYFWILSKIPATEFAQTYGERTEQQDEFLPILQIVAEGREDPVYHFKKFMKYDADPADRDRVVDGIFGELGGTDEALCESLHLTWDQCRELQAAGVELGCHTHTHPVLSKTTDEELRSELVQATESLRRELGDGATRTLAYPFGRRWDYDGRVTGLVEELGYTGAVNTHAGCNGSSTKRSHLHRWMVDNDFKMHLIATEACGGFDLLRRLGIDLSE